MTGSLRGGFRAKQFILENIHNAFSHIMDQIIDLSVNLNLIKWMSGLASTTPWCLLVMCDSILTASPPLDYNKNNSVGKRFTCALTSTGLCLYQEQKH